VAVLHWPEDAAMLEELRASGTPRLIVVAPEATAPALVGCDEDWIRLPASDDDVRNRMESIGTRSAHHATAPQVNGDGRISFRGRWVALSNTEEALARALAARVGEVVPAVELGACIEPPLSGNAVRIQVMRLRQRLGELGLEVRTVRNRGYVLEPTREAAPVV
jgi:DNA-binding response OmpR family regulator